MGLRRKLEMIRRRKWTILTCGVVVGVAIGGVSALRPPEYTAEARVRLAPDVVTPLDPLAIPGVVAVSDRTMVAFAESTTSAGVARQAAAALHVDATRIAASVTARRVGATDQIAVVAKSEHRAEATRAANASARAAIAARQLAAVGTLQRAANGLDPELASLKSRMADLDAQVRARTGTTAATAQLDAAASQFQTLESRQQDLRRAADGLAPGASLVHA
ncbi:MAG: Wzz/FepE/Etk N-terminal domain-containing protein, partial [Acidimicrobiia bacterium]